MQALINPLPFSPPSLSLKDQPISQWLHDNYGPLFGRWIAIPGICAARRLKSSAMTKTTATTEDDRSVHCAESCVFYLIAQRPPKDNLAEIY